MAHALRIFQAPSHGLHTAQAATNNGCPGVYAKHIGELRLAVDPVTKAQHRKIWPPDFAGVRVDGVGSRCAVTATDIVGHNNKKLIGIDGLSRADATVPPAWLFAFSVSVISRRMVVSTEGMANKYSVIFC